MSLSPVNLGKFLDLHNALGGVKYKLGGKASPLSKAPSSIQSIDCSGYVRYMLYHCAGGLMIPDGSWIQREYMERNGLREVSYAKAARDTSKMLYIAFATPNTNGVRKVGHVWFVLNGKTYESYSSKGVGSLAATQSWRASHVHKTFVLPTTLIAEIQPTYLLRQSSGAEMARMPTFDGHNYVPARAWGEWFGLGVDWVAKKGIIEMRNRDGFYETYDDVKIVKGVGHVRFDQAAVFTGVNYVTDNGKREIRLQPRVGP